MSAAPPRPVDALLKDGMQLQAGGRYAQAAARYREAVERGASDPRVFTSLGMCEAGAGNFPGAVESFERALAATPADARAMNNLGWALVRAGDAARALGLFRQAVAADPRLVEGWTNLGEQLYRDRKDAEALACFERVLELQPDHPEFEFLGRALRGETPERAPDRFLAGYFDRFAPVFEQRLTGELGYRAPELAGELLQPWLASHAHPTILDLGCGTGLSGAALRTAASHLTGVDISAGMLARAKARGVYDELVQEEIHAYLERCPPARFDLVLALDVLIYVGALPALFRLARKALAPRGAFAFTVELLPGEDGDYRLLRGARYAHSRGYVASVAGESGFAIGEMREAVLRYEGALPVAGDLYRLEARA